MAPQMMIIKTMVVSAPPRPLEERLKSWRHRALSNQRELTVNDFSSPEV